MPYYPPASSSSGAGFPVYYVEAPTALSIPVDYENVCTTILTVDGILQIDGKATVL